MPYDPFLAGLLGRKGLSPFSAASLARFARSELRTVRDPRQRSGISGRGQGYPEKVRDRRRRARVTDYRTAPALRWMQFDY
eukprot:660812-Prorocentrum_minimum.AAC.2